jgi:hypothetical protein
MRRAYIIQTTGGDHDSRQPAHRDPLALPALTSNNRKTDTTNMKVNKPMPATMSGSMEKGSSASFSVSHEPVTPVSKPS